MFLFGGEGVVGVGVGWVERKREGKRDCCDCWSCWGNSETGEASFEAPGLREVFRSALLLGVRWRRAKGASSLARLKVGTWGSLLSSQM